jgi:hypothetical protein
VKGAKKRSFLEKFTGGGAGKTEPASREWRREAAASRINQKRATRVKPSRPYFFCAQKEEKRKALSQRTQRKSTEVTEKSDHNRRIGVRKAPAADPSASLRAGDGRYKSKRAA